MAVALAGALVLSGFFVPDLEAQLRPGDPTMDERTVEVSWITSDERTVHATWFGSLGPPHGIVMALHQAGASGRGEYGPIIPRLTEGGWDVVAVDLREGGSRFGGENRTAGDDGGNGDYCAAEADLLGGIPYIRGVRADIPLVLFGSSYSAALALRAAAVHYNDVSGVVAFSPATEGPMAACRGEEVTEGLLTSILAVRPADEMERDSAQEQFRRLREQGHRTYVADPGVHGASTLVEERVGGDVEATWRVVEEFLRDVRR